MLDHSDALALLAFLKAHNGPWSTFMCTNGLADQFEWTRVRLVAARNKLIEGRYIRQVRNASTGLPALYEWTD
jgi:hypothetical protein